MTDAAFVADLIEYLTARGYKVTKGRAPRVPSQRKLLGAHLNGEHRGAHDEACRACRFARTIAQHRTHTFDVDGCALCIDRRTDYVFPSRLIEERTYLVA